MSYYDGGFAAQPYILTLELNECIEAEIEHEARKAANARLKAQWEAASAARKAKEAREQGLQA